jgi:hypothetical protein
LNVFFAGEPFFCISPECDGGAGSLHVPVSLCSFAMKGPPTECPFIGGEACLSSRRIVLILMA